MKTAHINCVYGVSSTGRLILDLVEEGKKNGIESRVFYSEGHDASPQAVRYISDAERNIHAVLSRLTGLQGYWSRAATQRLITLLDDFAPDAVHLHVIHGNCLNLSQLFAWLQKKQPKVIITLHDCWWLTGRCVHPTAYNCEKYTADCKMCPAKNDVCPSWFFDRADKMLTDKRRWLLGLRDLTVVAVSDWLKRQAERSFLPEEKITRIYNWINTDSFCPRNAAGMKKALGVEGKKVILGVASKWEARKGLSDFLWLSEHLPSEYTIVLVGDLGGSSSLPDNVLAAGPTASADELARYYSMAEVFVNPSRMETFGLTTIEAMACGTPAIVYDVTACPELIGPGTGAVVPLHKGAQGLLEAIIGIRKEPDVCREWVTAHFSREHGCKDYFKLYNETGER